MRILCEATWEKEGELVDGEPVYDKSQTWLLQWGMDYKLIEVEDGKIAAVNYSIAICENYNTGQVETYLPSQLRIIGKQIKE
jgi:hypothetical protein